MKKVLFSVMLVAAWLVAGCGGQEFSEFPPGDQDAGQDTGQEVAPDALDEQPLDTSIEADSSEDVSDSAPDVAPDVPEEAGEDVAPDVAPDTSPEASEDAEQDVAPDVQPDVLPDVVPDVQPDTAPDGPQPVNCELHGKPNQVTVIIRHAVDAPKVLAVAGKLTHDNVALDSSFQTWCWAGANQEELVCVPRDKNGQPAQPVVGVGLRVQFVPGQAMDGVQMNDTGMFCTATGCPPEGDYLVCNGKETLCHWDYTVLAGPTDLVIGPWGMQNLVCVFP